MMSKCRVSAPGKVILHGEHSAVYGKTAIAISLGVRTVAQIEDFSHPNSDNVFVVSLETLGTDQLTFEHINLEKKLLSKLDQSCSWCAPHTIDHDQLLAIVRSYLDDHIRNTSIVLPESQSQAILMVLYVFAVFMRNVLTNSGSQRLNISTDLTIGSGAGSSASFSVSLSGIMLQYLKVKFPQKYNDQMKNAMDNMKEFNSAEKELISSWAFLLEKITHGNPSGIDNATCTFGSLVEFRKGCNPVRHDVGVQLKICLVNTNVSRNTKKLVEKVASFRSRHVKIVDSLMDTCDYVSREALNVIGEIGSSTDVSIQQQKYEHLKELFDLNHDVLRALGVSHPSLENAVCEARKLGLGCKLTGAGGGGFAIVLIPPDVPDETIAVLMDNLSSHGLNGEVVFLGGEGVKVDGNEQ